MEPMTGAVGEQALSPHQILLVVDAMTGQDAVNSAKAFHEQLSIDGVILTKFDSDTRRRGADGARSRAPLKFIGTGEHVDKVREPTPTGSRRILGMGDVVSLVEKRSRRSTRKRPRRWPRRWPRAK